MKRPKVPLSILIRPNEALPMKLMPPRRKTGGSVLGNGVLFPRDDEVGGGLLQRGGQRGGVIVILRIAIDGEIVVDVLRVEGLAEGGDGDGHHLLGLHDAEEIISQLEVKGLVEAALFEDGSQVGVAAEAEGEGVEAVLIV